jgi:ABC-type branched-chain amino acid transport systems, periplasmic component
MNNLIQRRTLIKAGIAGLSVAMLPRMAFAQSEGPIKIGSLTPMTGAGANYGGRMRDAIAAVIDAVNAAGGIKGRQIQLVSEDDQTNPEAAVRAARKLIDVDGVSAILGTWASSVTTAVAPLCWESKTMLMCTSGADSITQLPHNGYVLRTEPGTALLMSKVGQFMVAEGSKKLGYLGVQTPFAQDYSDVMAAQGEAAGIETASVIYEADKTSYRSEVDQLLSQNPDFIFLGGYTPDTIVVLRDLYRAGYTGRAVSPSYTIDETALEALPAEVTEGLMTSSAVTPDDAPGLIEAKKLLGTDTIDPYTAQTYDHANLTVLALAAAATQDGEGIRDNVRAISQGEGQKVATAVEGIKLIEEGKAVDFDGASGDLVFDEVGDITTLTLRFDVVKNGAFEAYKTA